MPIRSMTCMTLIRSRYPKLRLTGSWAIDRGAKEGALKVSLEADLDRCRKTIVRDFVKENTPCSDFVRDAAFDGFSRLIFPSLEREVRNTLTEKAAEQAIRVFGVNLQQLLMQPPVKNAVILGLDPAYRTGCKLAVVGIAGEVLDTAVIYPTPPQNKVGPAKEKCRRADRKIRRPRHRHRQPYRLP